MKTLLTDTFGDFRCVHCRHIISADINYSGVRNRNHCPYCLWSRHLDWREAGDRLSACKGAMSPVGLAVKKARKKYGSEKQGELMLVHRCEDCGKVSANRIAADDVAEFVLEIYQRSLRLDRSTYDLIRGEGVDLLGAADSSLVYRRLFGYESSATRQERMPMAAD